MRNMKLDEFDLVEPPKIRDGFYGGRFEPVKLTIGALITALGMIISTIFLTVQPTPTATPPKQPDKNTFKDIVKRQMVKIANWLLGLAKKALVSLPGILGGLISFLFKKAGELVLSFSKHVIILLLAVIVFAVEITRKKMLKTE